MKSLGHILKTYWKQFLSVISNELHAIFTDAGVLLVVVLAIFIYTTIYSCAYGTQVLRNVPLGVVDMCKTPESRALVSAIDSGPNTVVAYEPTSMAEAEEMFFAREIYGVVYIPSDYSKNIYAGMQANVSLYLDGSYLLMYRQAFQELVAGIGTTGAMVEVQRLMAKGTNAQLTKSTVQPVIYLNTMPSGQILRDSAPREIVQQPSGTQRSDLDILKCRFLSDFRHRRRSVTVGHRNLHYLRDIFSLPDEIITANHLSGESEDVTALPNTIVVPQITIADMQGGVSLTAVRSQKPEPRTPCGLSLSSPRLNAA